MKRIFLFALILSATIAAQTDSLKVFELNPITIYASKYEQSLRTLSASYTTIGSSQIIQSDKSTLLSSLSGRVPGLFLSERGFGGFGISNPSGKISIRGISGIQEILVVVDGRPEFAGIFGHPVGDNYNSSQIEAVDVVRGPASVLFGSNAMGGVINISTNKEHSNGFSYSTEINYGSFNSRKLNGGVGFRDNKFAANISVNNDYTDDSRPSSSYNSSTGMMNATYYFDPAWTLDFNGYINTTKAYNPGTVDKPFVNNSVWTNATRANTSLSLHNKNEQSEGSATLFFNNGVHDIYDGFHSNDKLFGATVCQGFSFLEKNVTTFGAEIKNYGGYVKLPSLDTTVTESAAFVTINQGFGNRVSVNGGIRLSNHSVYGTELIPQINILIEANDFTVLNLSVSKGFRSPTLGELFLFGANINLKPERLWNYEIGLKHKLFGNKLQFNLTGFLIEGNDFIVMTGIYPNLKNQNLGSIRNRGIEAEANYLVTNNLSINASYSYLNMDTQIIGAPGSQAFIEANFSFGQFYFNLNMKSISNLLTAIPSGNVGSKSQSYFLTGANLWYKPIPQITLYIKGDNLLDRQYQIIDGYPMPGVTMRVGFTLAGTL